VSTALAGRMDGVAGDAGLAPPGYGHHQPRPAGAGPRPGGPPVPPAGTGHSGGSGTWPDGDAPFAGYAGQAAQEQDWPASDPDPWRGARWPGETVPGGDAAAEPPAADDMTADWPSSLPWKTSPGDDEEEAGS
jgi:hypothetical protein